MNPLKQLESCGQAPWLDYLKRSLLESGDLRVMIERDGLKGMTSNPSIFEKAIGESDEYAEAIRAFQAAGDHGVMAIYEHLAVADIRAAAAALRPVFDATAGRDGYISLECSPYVADDTEATVAEALRLWQAVDRPNLMVKVPATPAGVPAIRALIGKGLNINITLLFAVEVYEQVVEAYLAGLEEFQRAGGDLGRIASVASFFISRVDSEVDARLDAIGTPAALALRGKAAIAQAKLAYKAFRRTFSGPRWEALAADGAVVQRPLWASTSTKNPAYPDTLYVDQLIGPDSVNTLPDATIHAFADHGTVARTIDADVAEAEAIWAGLAEVGVDMDDVAAKLEREGVASFQASFDELLAALATKAAELGR